MPTMLGAQLEDLSSLATQLASTTNSIGDCRASSTSSTDNVVQTVRSAAATVLGQINAQMDALRSAVAAANSSTNAAEWTGANAARFRSAYGEFDAAMRAAETTTKDTYADFNRAIDQMAASLSSFVAQLSTSLNGAQSSTQSMRGAVEAQRANLDMVMNTGLSVG